MGNAPTRAGRARLARLEDVVLLPVRAAELGMRLDSFDVLLGFLNSLARYADPLGNILEGYIALDRPPAGGFARIGQNLLLLLDDPLRRLDQRYERLAALAGGEVLALEVLVKFDLVMLSVRKVAEATDVDLVPPD